MKFNWNENELSYYVDDHLQADLGFKRLDSCNIYVIEHLWTRNDQHLKPQLMTEFLNHFAGKEIKILPLCPDALAFFNLHPQYHSFL